LGTAGIGAVAGLAAVARFDRTGLGAGVGATRHLLVENLGEGIAGLGGRGVCAIAAAIVAVDAAQEVETNLMHRCGSHVRKFTSDKRPVVPTTLNTASSWVWAACTLAATSFLSMPSILSVPSAVTLIWVWCASVVACISVSLTVFDECSARMPFSASFIS